MRSCLLSLILLTGSASAADHWVEYRIGPFHVFSDAGDKAARDRLNEMEQLRHVLGVMVGKESLGVGGPGQSSFQTIWPVDLFLFSGAKEYAPHALKTPFLEGGSAMLAAWTSSTPLPRDLLRALTRMLIDENVTRMPEEIETALCDLFSTIKVTGPKGTIGTPPPAGELPPERFREWAKMQLLATNPDYSGKIRVYLNNMQGVGDEALAARSAFGLTLAKLNEIAAAYAAAGKFEPGPVIGEALNPNQDFVEKQVDKVTIDGLLAELAGDGKTFPPDSPRGLVEKGTRDALEQAIKANPRWGEPHYRIADLVTEPGRELKELKTAADLDPRNMHYWQALAEAQRAAHQFTEADKSWAAALKAAPNEAERARIKQERFDQDEKRAAFEAAEKKRIADEQARDLQRVKDNAAAEVNAAQDAANKRLGEFKSDQKPVDWWENPSGEKISGTLARVDCLNGPLRLTINIDGGGTIRLLIRDPNHLAVPGTGEAKFGCGVQRPPRKIKVVYTLKADAKMNTVGDVALVDFP